MKMPWERNDGLERGAKKFGTPVPEAKEGNREIAARLNAVYMGTYRGFEMQQVSATHFSARDARGNVASASDADELKTAIDECIEANGLKNSGEAAAQSGSSGGAVDSSATGYQQAEKTTTDDGKLRENGNTDWDKNAKDADALQRQIEALLAKKDDASFQQAKELLKQKKALMDKMYTTKPLGNASDDRAARLKKELNDLERDFHIGGSEEDLARNRNRRAEIRKELDSLDNASDDSFVSRCAACNSLSKEPWSGKCGNCLANYDGEPNGERRNEARRPGAKYWKYKATNGRWDTVEAADKSEALSKAKAEAKERGWGDVSAVEYSDGGWQDRDNDIPPPQGEPWDQQSYEGPSSKGDSGERVNAVVPLRFTEAAWGNEQWLKGKEWSYDLAADELVGDGKRIPGTELPSEVTHEIVKQLRGRKNSDAPYKPIAEDAGKTGESIRSNTLENATHEIKLTNTGWLSAECSAGDWGMTITEEPTPEGRERLKREFAKHAKDAAAGKTRVHASFQNAGHLASEPWAVASADERMGWLISASQDADLACFEWPDLSMDAQKALQDVWDMPASRNEPGGDPEPQDGRGQTTPVEERANSDDVLWKCKKCGATFLTEATAEAHEKNKGSSHTWVKVERRENAKGDACPSCGSKETFEFKGAHGDNMACSICDRTWDATRKNADDKGPFDQPNKLGCNGCDAIKPKLNKDGYCKECAAQQGARQNASDTGLCHDCSHPGTVHDPVCKGEGGKPCSHDCRHFVKRDSDGGPNTPRENAGKCAVCKGRGYGGNGARCEECGGSGNANAVEPKENAISESQWEELARAYEKLGGIDPSSSNGAKFLDTIHSADDDTIRQLAAREIKFVSKIARNEMSRRGLKNASDTEPCLGFKDGVSGERCGKPYPKGRVAARCDACLKKWDDSQKAKKNSTDWKAKVAEGWTKGKSIAEMEKELGITITHKGSLSDLHKDLMGGNFEVRENAADEKWPDWWADDADYTPSETCKTCGQKKGHHKPSCAIGEKEGRKYVNAGEAACASCGHAESQHDNLDGVRGKGCDVCDKCDEFKAEKKNADDVEQIEREAQGILHEVSEMKDERKNAKWVPKCPKCKQDVWDVASGSKLHKCRGCGTAFDTESAANYDSSPAFQEESDYLSERGNAGEHTPTGKKDGGFDTYLCPEDGLAHRKMLGADGKSRCGACDKELKNAITGTELVLKLKGRRNAGVEAGAAKYGSKENGDGKNDAGETHFEYMHKHKPTKPCNSNDMTLSGPGGLGCSNCGWEQSAKR